MGRNKALLPFDGVPMITYQFTRLSPLFCSTYISVKNSEPFPDSLPLIPDGPDTADAAPAVGFLALFNRLREERVFVLSVDAPFVDQTIIEKLVTADTSGVDAVIARTPQGVHPLCGIYHRSLQRAFETMVETKQYTLSAMLRTKKVRYVDFDNEDAFANLNHPDEYEAAVKKVENRLTAEEVRRNV